MKKKMLSKKLQLSRETLRDLHDPALGGAVGGQVTLQHRALLSPMLKLEPIHGIAV